MPDADSRELEGFPSYKEITPIEVGLSPNFNRYLWSQSGQAVQSLTSVQICMLYHFEMHPETIALHLTAEVHRRGQCQRLIRCYNGMQKYLEGSKYSNK